jgi:hypothetical protein
VSEATRGVITILTGLGISSKETRDLRAVRTFYQSYRAEGAERFCEQIFSQSGIEYAIMTNIPFDSNEAKYWRGPQWKDYSKLFRSALCVDPFLVGDKATIATVLKASGYDVTLEGAQHYLLDLCDTMNPEYMMASTPRDFCLREGTISGVKKTGVNAEDAMKEPPLLLQFRKIWLLPSKTR